jgi:hypothetical protein
MTEETKLRLQKMSQEEKEQRFNELNDPIINPVLLGDGRKQPETTLEKMEEREWLKTFLGY